MSCTFINPFSRPISLIFLLLMAGCSSSPPQDLSTPWEKMGITRISWEARYGKFSARALSAQCENIGGTLKQPCDLIPVCLMTSIAPPQTAESCPSSQALQHPVEDSVFERNSRAVEASREKQLAHQGQDMNGIVIKPCGAPAMCIVRRLTVGEKCAPAKPHEQQRLEERVNQLELKMLEMR